MINSWIFLPPEDIATPLEPKPGGALPSKRLGKKTWLKVKFLKVSFNQKVPQKEEKKTT